MPFPRITIRADQLGGAPCIRGLRIPVSWLAQLIAEGATVDEVLSLYPDLEGDDVAEALRCASEPHKS